MITISVLQWMRNPGRVDPLFPIPTLGAMIASAPGPSCGLPAGFCCGALCAGLLRPRRRGHDAALAVAACASPAAGSHCLRRRSASPAAAAMRMACGGGMRRSPHRLRRRVSFAARLRAPAGGWSAPLPAAAQPAAAPWRAWAPEVGLGAAVSSHTEARRHCRLGALASAQRIRPRAASWWVSVQPVWPRAIRSDPISFAPDPFAPGRKPCGAGGRPAPCGKAWGLARQLRREKNARHGRRRRRSARHGAWMEARALRRGVVRRAKPRSAQQASARPARRGSPADAHSARPQASLRPAAERDFKPPGFVAAGGALRRRGRARLEARGCAGRRAGMGVRNRRQASALRQSVIWAAIRRARG